MGGSTFAGVFSAATPGWMSAGRSSGCLHPARRRSRSFVGPTTRSLRRIRAFAPDFLVVALGLDAFEGDPFGGLSVTTPGFSRIAEAIAGLGTPSVIVQEGGYLCDALGEKLTAFLTGFGAISG